jgi:transcriptional regulator with XRE-family HTH domain
MRVPATELARVREARALSQKQLAELLGISPSTLSSVENGHSRPWPKLRRECAQILGLSEETLFPEKEGGNG